MIWEGDIPLQHPFNRTVIYEMHVRGFTRDPQFRRGHGEAGAPTPV